MEQRLDDQYDVEGMDSLSGLISKRIGTCNIGVEAMGGGCKGQAAHLQYVSKRCRTNP